MSSLFLLRLFFFFFDVEQITLHFKHTNKYTPYNITQYNTVVLLLCLSFHFIWKLKIQFCDQHIKNKFNAKMFLHFSIHSHHFCHLFFSFYLSSYIHICIDIVGIAIDRWMCVFLYIDFDENFTILFEMKFHRIEHTERTQYDHITQ